MSTYDGSKEELEFWEKIGLVIIYVSDGGVIIGRIIEVKNSVITIRDLQGLRHWITQDSISRIMELGESQIKTTS